MKDDFPIVTFIADEDKGLFAVFVAEVVFDVPDVLILLPPLVLIICHIYSPSYSCKR